MKKMIYPALTALILLTSAAYSVSTVDYKIKEGYKIEFKSKDPTGTFNVKGTIKFDENDLANSKFDLTFPVSSISTGNAMKNKKAQTSEWFEATKYPDIKYTSTKIEKSGNDYMVTGTLKMKGISKEKKVPLKVTKNGNDLTFSGTFTVNRIDYKVGKPSEAVPNMMNISYSIPVTKK